MGVLDSLDKEEPFYFYRRADRFLVVKLCTLSYEDIYLSLLVRPCFLPSMQTCVGLYRSDSAGRWKEGLL